MNHRGFQYQLGLNVDTGCLHGLHYTTREHLHKFLHLGVLIADVSVPIDAVVQELYSDRFKSNKLILSNIRPLIDFEHISTICRTLVNTCYEPLKYMPSELLTKELCLAAIKRDGCMIQYVPKAFLEDDVYIAALSTIQTTDAMLCILTSYINRF